MNSSSIKIQPRWKAILEALLGALLVFGYIWYIIPRRISWMHIAFPLLFLGLLFYSKHSRRESLKDLGVRLDNWLPSLKILLTTMMPFGIILIILWVIIFPVNPNFYKQFKFWKRLLTYPFSAFIQQYIALAFFFRRLKDAFFPSLFPAIFFSAVFFSAAHIPNYPLMLIAFFTGLICAWVYHKYNNLITISLFHGVFATFFLTVLLMYFTFGPYADAGKWTKTKWVYSSIDRINNVKPNNKNSPILIKKADDYFSVSGWAVGKDYKIERVYIRIGYKDYVCKYGLKREDVAVAYHNPDYTYCGYYRRIPISGMKPGYYLIHLKIQLKDRRYPHYPSKMALIKIEA